MRQRTHWIGIAFAVGVVVLALAAASHSLPYTQPQRMNWLKGDTTRRFESHYDRLFPVKTFGTNLWAALQYVLFREGRPGVVVGQDGWLYTQEEFRDYPDSRLNLIANLQSISAVDAQLRQHGIQLIVALVPAKARLYPEHVDADAPATVHRDLYPEAQRVLAMRGVRVPDLSDALTQCKATRPVFLRTDTHWTPDGAQCAARALAAEMGAHPTQRYITEVQAVRWYAGDLMRYLPLTPYFRALLPAPDRLVEPSTSALDGETGLLADAPAPEVVLVGSSYSADARWNFDGALREALGKDVLNLAQTGRGPFVPMFEFLRDAANSSPVRLIVWEIPERYLLRDDHAH